MSENRVLAGYRYVEIQYGDTLQGIALRELGDASKWPDLISINNLLPPYISATPAPRVLVYGQTIIVPSTSAPESQTSDPDSIYGSDVVLENGEFVIKNGDISLISGKGNLIQAMQHRLSTWLKDLIYHPLYGNGAFALKGHGNTPTDGLLAAKYVSDSLLQDPRIDAVSDVTARAVGDALIVEGTATPRSGSDVDFKAEI